MNSHGNQEFNVLCNAVRKFRQRHAPQSSMTLILKLDDGVSPRVFRSNPELDPVAPKRPRPSQMPLTAYYKRKKTEEDQIESDKGSIWHFDFFLSYLAEPIDEPGSSTLGDYANPFDDSQPDSQESTLSADFTTIDVKITRQKKDIEEDNLDSEEEIEEENGIEGDYEGGEEVEQEETSDQEIQAILNFSQRQG